MSRILKALNLGSGAGAARAKGFTVQPPDSFTFDTTRQATPAELYRNNSAVRAVIDILAAGVASADFRAVFNPVPGEVSKPVKDTKLTDALNAPGVLFGMAADLAVYGETVQVMANGRTFVRIPPPLAKEDGEGMEITGWEIAGKRYSPKDVLHIKLYTADTGATNLRRGVSKLEAVTDLIAENDAAYKAMAAIWRGSGVYTKRPLEAPGLDETGREALEGHVTRSLNGIPGTNEPRPTVPVLDEGMELGSIPMDERMRNWSDGRRLVYDQLCALYAIPSAMVAPALSDRNVEAAQRSFVTDACAPVGSLIADEVTAQAVPVFYGDKRIAVVRDTSDRTRDRFGTRAKAYSDAIDAGWLSIDEVRAMEGLPPQ